MAMGPARAYRVLRRLGLVRTRAAVDLGAVDPLAFAAAPVLTPAAMAWGDTATVDWTGEGPNHTVSVTWYHDGVEVEVDSLGLGNGARSDGYDSPPLPSFVGNVPVLENSGAAQPNDYAIWTWEESALAPPSAVSITIYADGVEVHSASVTPGAGTYTIQLEEAWVGDLYAVVRLTTPGGSYVEAQSNTIPIGYPPGVSSATVSPTTATVGDTLTASVVATGTDTTTTIQWRLDGVDIPGETGTTYTTDTAGTVDYTYAVSSAYGPTVTGTSSNSCEVSASTVLVAQYNGGEELHDGSGHLPRNGSNQYISRTTGDLLVIDDGLEVGDPVGPHRISRLLSATVVGDLTNAGAIGRLEGFRPVGSTNYATETLGAAAWGFLALTQMSTVRYTSSLFGVASATERALIQRKAGSSVWRIVVDAGSGDVEATITDTVDAERYFGGSYDPTTGTLICASWDPADVASGPVDVDTVTDPAAVGGDLSGETLVLGNHYNINDNAWNRDVEIAIGWVGVAPSEALMEATAASHAAGDSIDDILTVAGPYAFALVGLICGAADEASPDDLFFAVGGPGASVTVEEA